MYTDLHMHTIYSDGEFSPMELVALARTAGISTMAITDHNNLRGSKEAIANNIYSDITIIPGVEFSAKAKPQINIHILGYNVDLNDPELNELAEAYEQDAKNQVKSLLELLKSEYDIAFSDKQVEKVFSLPGNIGRPEVAKLCLEAGHATSIEDAFKRFLNPVKPRQAKKQVNPTDEALIKYIIDAGGIPCLAHPGSLNKSIWELREYIKKLMTYGLQAIEVYHSKNPYHLTMELKKITDEYGLYASVGSDYHGPIVSPDVYLRRGINDNLNIEMISILDKFTEVKIYDKKS